MEEYRWDDESRWDLFSYDELLIIYRALPRDVLRWTDLSQNMYKQVENAMNKHRKESLTKGAG